MVDCEIEWPMLDTDNSGKQLYGYLEGYTVADGDGRLLNKKGQMAFTYNPRLYNEQHVAQKKASDLEIASSGLYRYEVRKFISWSYQRK